MSAGQKMILSGGAQADNIVWQVAGEVDFGATSHAEGNILAKKYQASKGTGVQVSRTLSARQAAALG